PGYWRTARIRRRSDWKQNVYLKDQREGRFGFAAKLGTPAASGGRSIRRAWLKFNLDHDFGPRQPFEFIKLKTSSQCRGRRRTYPMRRNRATRHQNTLAWHYVHIPSPILPFPRCNPTYQRRIENQVLRSA